VSSVNNIGSDTEIIVRGRSVLYITKNKESRTDPWGTPRFNVPQSEKKIELY
jgi:hypothetical protein